MANTHYGFCNFCDAICGLAIEVESFGVLATWLIDVINKKRPHRAGPEGNS